ncbi:hypothetical protein JW960_26315 [candidate division KSB1 bacterium]|nr:hypothetical protein [candidate division KSB1 bacterium]
MDRNEIFLKILLDEHCPASRQFSKLSIQLDRWRSTQLESIFKYESAGMLPHYENLIRSVISLEKVLIASSALHNHHTETVYYRMPNDFLN